jgi:hypothetical protein
MKYMTANMAAPVAKLMPTNSPTSFFISSCHGIMAFCIGNTLAITLPGTIAHSYTNHATVNTPPTTTVASTDAESHAYVLPAHVNPNTNNPNPQRNNNCPPRSNVANLIKNRPVLVP